MVKVKLLATDNDNEGNRELAAFLKQNVAALVAAGVIFEFRIITKEEAPALVAKGIDGLPAAHVGEKLVIDSTEIVAALNKYLTPATPGRRGAASRKSRILEHPDDAMREMYADEMSMDAAMDDQDKGEGEDLGGSSKRDLLEKYNEEVQRRQEEEARRAPKTNAKGARRASPTERNRRRNNVPDDQEDDMNQGPAAPSATRSRAPAAAAPGGKVDKDDAMLMNMLEETS